MYVSPSSVLTFSGFSSANIVSMNFEVKLNVSHAITMKLLLILIGIVLPFAVGDNVKCYDGIDCKHPCRALPQREIYCSSQCLKVDFEMSDKSVATARVCGAAYLGNQGPVFSLFNLTTYAPGTKAIPEITAGHVYLCKKNLCNGGGSIVPTSLLVFFVAAVLGGINHKIFQ